MATIETRFPADDEQTAKPGHSESGAVLDLLASRYGPVPRVSLTEESASSSESIATVPPAPESFPQVPTPEERPTRVRLVGEIARGGMGAVLRGRDPDLGRDLAVKVLLEKHRDRLDLVRRFVEEAQIGGQLQHPGIVPVYELGTFPDSRPYFTMKLVKGRTLAELLEERVASPFDAELPRFLPIFEQIAQTMAYAHARGVIHRDLKPLNVMTGTFGEVQVMDWGLAKVLSDVARPSEDVLADPLEDQDAVRTARSDSNAGESVSGSVMGTPPYMSPEQASGRLDLVDRRADVFALGSILCEILTGKPAYSGAGFSEILEKASRGDLSEALDRLERSGAESELILLARDCLAVAPEDRPSDAAAVADRIRRYISGVQDRLKAAEMARVAATARAEEEAKRRRTTLALAASLLALLGVGGGAAIYVQRQRAERLLVAERGVGHVETLIAGARRRPEDPALWREVLAAANQVDRDVAVNERLSAGIAEAEKALAQSQRDASLRLRLQEIRSDVREMGRSAADAAYASAFREVGLDLDELSTRDVAGRLLDRPSGVKIELAGYLDHWLMLRRNPENPSDSWRKVVEVAQAIDPDEYRKRIRAILRDETLDESHTDALKRLMSAPEAASLPAPSMLLLASVMYSTRNTDARIEILRKAVDRHPEDVWVNYEYANALFDVRPIPREEAIRYYSAARALRPETSHYLGHLLDDLGRTGESLAVFEDLRRRLPRNARHLACLGGLLQNADRQAEAREVLEQAIAAGTEAVREKPTDFVLRHDLGLALGRIGRFDESLAEYRESIRLNPINSEAHANVGVLLKKQGKVEDALAALREAIRLDPKSHSALLELGDLLETQGKREESIVAFREAIRLNPEFADAHYNLALSLGLQARTDEAIASYRQAIRARPNFAKAHTNLGVELKKQGKDAEAIACWREAIRIEPGRVEALHNLGLALTSEKKLVEAVAFYREAIRRKPDDHQYRFELGSLLDELEKYAEAAVEYREACRIRPDHAESRYNFGNTLMNLEKFDDAIAAFRETIRIEPAHYEARFNVGYCLKKLARIDEAIAAYREAARMRPDDPEVHASLASALDDRGDSDAAIASYREAIRLKPDYAEAHSDMALVLAEQGKLDESLVEHREAIRLKPDDALARFNFAELLKKRGAYEESLAEYRRAFEIEGKREGAHPRYAAAVPEAETRLALSRRVPAILKGTDAPKDAAETVALAQLFYDAELHQASARFWRQAFMTDPTFAESDKSGFRYEAACAAALAGCGLGKDDPSPTPEKRAELRDQAAAWLRAELTRHAKRPEIDSEERRIAVVRTLSHWTKDSDLAGIRDSAGLEKLPKKEQEAWKAFWGEVHVTLKSLDSRR